MNCLRGDLYPEVVVLKDEDFRDPAAFAAKLREPPFLIKIPSGDGRWVRQFWMKPDVRCLEFPFHAPGLITETWK